MDDCESRINMYVIVRKFRDPASLFIVNDLCLVDKVEVGKIQLVVIPNNPTKSPSSLRGKPLPVTGEILPGNKYRMLIVSKHASYNDALQEKERLETEGRILHEEKASPRKRNKSLKSRASLKKKRLDLPSDSMILFDEKVDHSKVHTAELNDSSPQNDEEFRTAQEFSETTQNDSLNTVSESSIMAQEITATSKSHSIEDSRNLSEEKLTLTEDEFARLVKYEQQYYFDGFDSVDDDYDKENEMHEESKDKFPKASTQSDIEFVAVKSEPLFLDNSFVGAYETTESSVTAGPVEASDVNNFDNNVTERDYNLDFISTNTNLVDFESMHYFPDHEKKIDEIKRAIKVVGDQTMNLAKEFVEFAASVIDQCKNERIIVQETIKNIESGVCHVVNRESNADDLSKISIQISEIDRKLSKLTDISHQNQMTKVSSENKSTQTLESDYPSKLKKKKEDTKTYGTASSDQDSSDIELKTSSHGNSCKKVEMKQKKKVLDKKTQHACLCIQNDCLSMKDINKIQNEYARRPKMDKLAISDDEFNEIINGCFQNTRKADNKYGRTLFLKMFTKEEIESSTVSGITKVCSIEGNVKTEKSLPTKKFDEKKMDIINQLWMQRLLRLEKRGLSVDPDRKSPQTWKTLIQRTIGTNKEKGKSMIQTIK